MKTFYEFALLKIFYYEIFIGFAEAKKGSDAFVCCLVLWKKLKDDSFLGVKFSDEFFQRYLEFITLEN